MRKLSGHEQRIALQLCHIPLPEDATDCEPWEWCDVAWRRLFAVREWQVGAIMVGVAGEQADDGQVTRWVYVGGEEQLSDTRRQELVEVLSDAGRLLQLHGQADLR